MKVHTTFRRTYASWSRPTVGFVGGIQLVTASLAVAAPFTAASPQWWLLALLGYFLYGCIGATVGYHRYFAHRSFRASRWAELLFIACGVFGCSGSPASWVMMHRQHHRHADNFQDPHSPRRYGLSVLLIHRYGPQDCRWSMRRLFARDPIQLWVHRHYVPLVLGFAAALLVVDWHLFLFGWAVPVAIKLAVSGMAVYFTHMGGYRNFATNDESGNVWWLGYLAWGEGWHNNHHAKPGRWDFQVRWWETDIGAWTVRAITWIDRLLVNRPTLPRMKAAR